MLVAPWRQGGELGWHGGRGGKTGGNEILGVSFLKPDEKIVWRYGAIDEL